MLSSLFPFWKAPSAPEPVRLGSFLSLFVALRGASVTSLAEHMQLLGKYNSNFFSQRYVTIIFLLIMLDVIQNGLKTLYVRLHFNFNYILN